MDIWTAFMAINNCIRGRSNDVGVGKWFFFVAQAVLTFIIVKGDWKLVLLWELAFALYAVGPWQAMFSAIHGRPPGRRDDKAWDWMQTLAYKIVGMEPLTPQAYGPRYFKNFGSVYGAIRGAIVIPGLLIISAYSGNWDVSIWGTLVFLNLGNIYRAWGIVIGEGYSVFCAELTMGALLGILVAGSV